MRKASQAVTEPPRLLASCFFAAIDCTKCKLTYEPVVHVKTNTPFYNDCLGRCQLGDAEVFQPVRTAVSDGQQPDPITQLLPLPVNPSGGSLVTVPCHGRPSR